MTNRKSLENALISLGISEGDIVFTAGAAPGPFTRGITSGALIESILAIVGFSGTLCTASYNYPNSSQKHLFDGLAAKTEVFCSPHPLFSFSAIGAKAELITKNHDLQNPFGGNTPVSSLVDLNAKILCLGFDSSAFPFIHHAESLAKVPYYERFTNITGSHGKPIPVRVPGCTANYWAIADVLGLAEKTSKTIFLLSAKQVAYSVAEILRRYPSSLLCEQPDCWLCAESRALIDAVRDWIRESQHGPVVIDADQRRLSFLGDRDTPNKGKIFKRKDISLEEFTQEGRYNAESHKN